MKTTESLCQWFQEYETKKMAYDTALNICYFDETTVAPQDGAAFRGEMMAVLAGEQFAMMTAPGVLENLRELQNRENADPILRQAAHQHVRDLERICTMPQVVYVHQQTVLSQAEHTWRKAKQKKDYELFEADLTAVIEVVKQRLSYQTIGKTPYDTLLDQYEEGLTVEKADQFFERIKQRLVPFIQTVAKRKDMIDDRPLFGYFAADQQARLMEDLQDYMRVDRNKIYMGETEHPYTMKVCGDDNRITTRYDEHALASSIFSIIHEYGHALYGAQVDSKLDRTILADNMSMSMHESQSRFLENYIGKRESFWVNNYPKLVQRFPEFEAVSLKQFVHMINASYPSLIRTEADELTYPLHVLIRYELEKELFNGSLQPSDLQQAWNDAYERYLGIRPSDDAEGILQDSHWAGGAFGYFPTYALGSAYAAQFFEAMQQDIDVDEALADDRFDQIAGWLKEKIHRFGATKTSDELLREVTGKPFDPDVYMDYLIRKYSALYHI